MTYSCAGELQLPGCTAKCFQCTVGVPSIFFWTELFLDLLLCRRVTVASCTAKCFQCTVRVLSIFFGLNSFLTYCCAGELQFASCTVRVLCFFGLNSFLTCCCAGELQSPGCTICCQVLPMYCQSTFNLSGEVTSVFFVSVGP